MPDIAMCDGRLCNQAKSCWRHVAKPSRVQSYFSVEPLEDEDNCKYFMQATKEEIDAQHDG